MKKRWKVLWRVMASILIMISSVVTGVNPVNAYDLVNVSDFPQQEKVTYNGKAVYGESIVGDFSIGGKLAFCMQHSLTTPPTGTKLSSKIYNNEDVRKVLYYGYGGIKPWSGFKDRQHGIVVTSLTLSHFFNGDHSAPSTIKSFVSYIEKKSVPNYAIQFSKAKARAYRSGDIQRTESITLESGSDEFALTMKLQDQVTFVDESHNTRQTGGSVSVRGQTSFHLEAPLHVKLAQWTTGKKTSSYAYQPIISEPSSASLQKLGRGSYVVDQSKTTSLTVDWLELSSLELTKTDVNGTLIDGAVFRLWNNQGYDQNLTVTNGKIKIDQLLIGEYFLQEKSAPEGYLVDDTIYTIVLNAGDEIKKVVSNKEPLGQINLQKSIDSEITNGLLGEAYLSGVEYGLYAKEDIKNAAGTKTFYVKDQLISQKKTDDNGKISWEQLPLGRYYIKEVNSNPSLVVNSEIYDVTLSYQNMSTSLVVKQVNVQDRIASQRIQIFKEGTKEGTAGVVQGLQGAEFTFVLNSDYEEVGFEKAKKYFVGSTDINGFLTTPLLPYGVYRVKETKTPEGYYGATDFLITIDKDSSLYEIGYQIQKVTVNNLPYESLLKVIKLDQETGKIVQRAGATFKIKNLDTNEYVSYTDWSAFPSVHVDQWTTHSNGTITLNTKLKTGHYQLEEIKAPEGYLLNEVPLPFEITDQSYEISDDQVTPITIVKFSDRAVKGQITFDKQGEVLSDFQNGRFIYEGRGLANTKFVIKAKENILDPSHDGSFLYNKGDTVEILTTDSQGKVTSSKLPLGEYTYQELETPEGYVLNNEVKAFSLTYQDQILEVVHQNHKVINERSKVAVSVGKKDEDTLQYLNGAKISLIANRDIYNADQKMIVKAGTIIETIVSSHKGRTLFQSDLPIDYFEKSATVEVAENIESIGNVNALFMVKEEQPPAGYAFKNIQYYVDTTSQDLNNQQLLFEYDFLNKKIPVETQDSTVLLSYLLMGVGAILIIRILFKTKE